MAKKSSAAPSTPRYPANAQGIQINFCRNPFCSNFGTSPAPKVTRGRTPKSGVRLTDTYIVFGGANPQGANVPSLKCKLCGQTLTVKSNQAIQEELTRISAYLTPFRAPSCPNIWCWNRYQDILTAPDEYCSFGKTASGAQRYRCKACKATLSIPKSTQGQQQPHKNRIIFMLLVNKSPFRRICEVADISPSTLYHRIDFLHRQCLAFAGDRERTLLEGLVLPRLHVSVDRQDYVVNWSERKDKRNVTLTAMGSADNRTGFVFGMNCHFSA